MYVLKTIASAATATADNKKNCHRLLPLTLNMSDDDPRKIYALRKRYITS